jgi:hypothetical protein
MPFDLKAGIVRILAADGTTTSGTGFILSEKGIIATCSHVVQAEKLQVRGYHKPEKVEVIFRSNGQKGSARLLPAAWRAAEAEDVALLQLEGPLPEGVVPLSIGSSEAAAGHAFQTFGFPDFSPEEGIYGEGSLLDQTAILGIRVLQVKSSEITPGFSGAPGGGHGHIHCCARQIRKARRDGIHHARRDARLHLSGSGAVRRAALHGTFPFHGKSSSSDEGGWWRGWRRPCGLVRAFFWSWDLREAGNPLWSRRA